MIAAKEPETPQVTASANGVSPGLDGEALWNLVRNRARVHHEMFKVARRFGLRWQDETGIGWECLIRLIVSYDPFRTPGLTYERGLCAYTRRFFGHFYTRELARIRRSQERLLDQGIWHELEDPRDGLEDRSSLLGWRTWRRALRRLDKRQRRALLRNVKDGVTLEELGAAEGITRERVRQIKSRAIERLRFALVDAVTDRRVLPPIVACAKPPDSA